MVEVAGRPFLDWQLERFRENGATEVLFLLSHLAEQIRAHLGAGERHGLPVQYVDDGRQLRGTGGAVRHALDLLAPDFVVTYGDSFLSLSPRDLLAYLDQAGDSFGGVMSVTPKRLAREPLNCLVADGRVARYEKGQGDTTRTHLDYGMIALRRSEVESWPDVGAFGLETPLGSMARLGRLMAFEVLTPYFEVGTPAGLAQLDAALRCDDR